jgi:crossover junction endodeoxyribonuclease RusA
LSRILLPWPPSCLTPNAKRRLHWRVYRHPAKDYRKTCALLTKAKRIRLDPGLVPMTITFNPPDRRHRDDDGMIGAFKHGRDGVADALGVDDRYFRPTYVFGEPVKGGCVTVEVIA